MTGMLTMPTTAHPLSGALLRRWFQERCGKCDDGNAIDTDLYSSLSRSRGDDTQIGEQCDDSNAENNDCTIRCEAPRCGDGFVQDGEACDDGANGVIGDGCNDRCEISLRKWCEDPGRPATTEPPMEIPVGVSNMCPQHLRRWFCMAERRRM